MPEHAGAAVAHDLLNLLTSGGHVAVGLAGAAKGLRRHVGTPGHALLDVLPQVFTFRAEALFLVMLAVTINFKHQMDGVEFVLSFFFNR